MEKTLIIINPVAGRRRARKAAELLVRAMIDTGQSAQVYTTQGKGDATRIAREMADGVDRIICCGGDGTLSEVLRGVMEAGSKVAVGYVPSGTTNDLAMSLRMPTQMNPAVQLAVHGRARQHDIGIFNQNQIFDYVASFGAFTQTPYETPQKLKNRLGHFAYVLFGIPYAFSLRTFHAHVVADDQEITGDFLFGSVSNATRLAGIIDLPKNSVRFDDGKFEVVLIHLPRADDLIRSGLSRRKKNRPQYVYFFSTSRITFSFSESVAWTLDGENGGSHQVAVIENRPRAVDIISTK